MHVNGDTPLATIHIDSARCVQVLEPGAFEDLITALGLAHRVHHHLAFAKRVDRELTTIFLASRRRPQVEQINRDDAWWERRLVSDVMDETLGQAGDVSPRMRHYDLPLRIIPALYASAFPAPGATDDDILRASTRNSQVGFDRIVGSFMAGRTTYDVKSYAQRGPSHRWYSHLEMFSWLYAAQIELALRFLRDEPTRNLTVIDLGCGAGHFLLVLLQQLHKRGLLHRVRPIGVDESEHDMRFGRELAYDLGLRIEFRRDDVARAGFPDWLRRQSPDLVVVNHMLEHLGPDVLERHLQDWLLSARRALSVSVPLNDHEESSLSDHTSHYNVARVEQLAQSMEIRVGFAVVAEDIEHTKHGGLIQWLRTPDVRRQGGLSARSTVLRPHPCAPTPDPLLADFAAPFDPAAFATARRVPLIGELRDRKTFEQQGNEPRQVRQLPIKFPGTAVIVPDNFAQFAEAIQLIIDHNRANNPSYEESYAYLNVFRGLTQFSSYRGLSLNCHGDQLQTLREGYAYPPDWSYIVSNRLPTIFFEHAFDIAEAVARARSGERVNVYDCFNQQADLKKSVRSQDFGVHLLSPYVVHCASDAEENVFRVFLKIAISRRRLYDNREFRRNSAFVTTAWYQEATVSYADGFFSHAHWNERLLKSEMIKKH